LQERLGVATPNQVFITDPQELQRLENDQSQSSKDIPQNIPLSMPVVATQSTRLPFPSMLSLIAEVEAPEALTDVGLAIAALGFPGTTAGNFINFSAPASLVSRLAELDGVRLLSYNAPVWIRTPPQIVGGLLGRITLSSVTIPSGMPAAIQSNILHLPLLPISLLGSLADMVGLKGIGKQLKTDVIMLTTGETRKAVGAPEHDNKIKTKVAVLDTGIVYPHPLLHPTKGMVTMLSTTGEPPLDGLGHGMWCITCAFGDTAPTRFGTCRGIVDPDAGNLIAIKCLSNVGFGTTFGVMQAMQLALDNGARVISMSLGGELQGSVKEDPQCQFIEQHHREAIFVVATGNSGPDIFTIGSPGVSPFAVTVGAWSTHYESVAIFSSRGPQGAFYNQRRDELAKDADSLGANMYKPDCVAPGGGPGSNLRVPGGHLPDPLDTPMDGVPDLIYSAVTGWMDGINDLTPGDGFGGMRGSSMACPHAAGIIALALDRGLISSQEDVKEKLAKTVVNSSNLKFGVRNGSTPIKDPRVGFGLITLDRLS